MKNPLVPIVLINYVRVIEVWFDDEQKDWFYRREPQVHRCTIEHGTQIMKLYCTHT